MEQKSGIASKKLFNEAAGEMYRQQRPKNIYVDFNVIEKFAFSEQVGQDKNESMEF